MGNNTQTLKIPGPVWWGPVAALIVAIFPMAYGYYTLLRLIVFGTAVFLTWHFLAKRDGHFLGWVFALVGLTYNPVFRVHFPRETWAIINVITIAPYLLIPVLDRIRKRKNR